MPSRTYRLAIPALSLALLLGTRPAHAVSKDMIQLQTQIQQLQDSVARLQQSNDERMGSLKDLVQQSADQTNKVAGIVDALQHQMQAQGESGGGKIDQISGQVQSLNDSLDEIKARLGRLEKLMHDVQGQQQSMSAALPSPGTPSAGPTPPDSGLPSTGAPASSTTPPDSLGSNVPETPSRRGKPTAGTPADAATLGSVNSTTPPPDQLYKAALGDYMSAKYGLSQSEFGDFTRAYPDNPLAGNAFYYQGEMDYRGARYGAAVKDYDRVLEQYPDSNKVPAAHLHKGQALIQLKQSDAGVRELRTLIQRFPNSPEALQARSKLSGMGIVVKPRQP